MLAMYRSIFEQCVSRPPSEQNSGVASPAHTRHVSRKHPSIISSAFCSSKKFPLRPLQALISNNDLRSRIFGSSHAPLSSGKGKIYFGKTCPDSTKTKVGYTPNALLLFIYLVFLAAHLLAFAVLL